MRTANFKEEPKRWYRSNTQKYQRMKKANEEDNIHLNTVAV